MPSEGVQWMKFRCSQPDFYLRSIPDGVIFGVDRRRLEERSGVLQNMFSCCDLPAAVNMEECQQQSMDIDERADILSILLHLLHMPLQIHDSGFAPSSPDSYTSFTDLPAVDSNAAIPLPVLPGLLKLVDKYELIPEVVNVMQSHLAAYVSTFPMKVYCYALQQGWKALAGEASAYLLHPPMYTYDEEDIQEMPSAVAYHRLVILQEYRRTRLVGILRSEAVFPHGYGECPSLMHTRNTTTAWENRKAELVNKINAGTDVAGEMRDILDEVKTCSICSAACQAAVEMLNYKCRRLARRVDALPSLRSLPMI